MFTGTVGNWTLWTQDTLDPGHFKPTKFVANCPHTYNLAYNCGHRPECPDDWSVLDTLALGMNLSRAFFGTKVSRVRHVRGPKCLVTGQCCIFCFYSFCAVC